jgi:hypothetical protein
MAGWGGGGSWWSRGGSWGSRASSCWGRRGSLRAGPSFTKLNRLVIDVFLLICYDAMWRQVFKKQSLVFIVAANDSFWSSVD